MEFSTAHLIAIYQNATLSSGVQKAIHAGHGSFAARDFIKVVASSAITWQLAAHGQQPAVISITDRMLSASDLLMVSLNGISY